VTLTRAQVSEQLERIGRHPSRALGQNFVVDPNTVRRIARLAGVGPGDRVVEIGAGLGSLTLALVETGATVTAVEIDRHLVPLLRDNVEGAGVTVVEADAMAVDWGELLGEGPWALVANLPYNVAVPVLLNLLELLPTLDRALVLVQAEVAERLAASPGGPAYGIPSVKAAWYGEVRRAGSIGRRVFWPEPNVDSGLVSLVRRPPPPGDRRATFAVVDAAFATRRKGLRAALARWAGSPAAAEARLRAAGIDPATRGEQLSVTDFARLAATAPVEPPPVES
jgi:16S rRNA (adenine1518-N6/adenine1519-N6)-dimethyltransferase